jgi:chromosome segregation ATPase
VDSLGADEGRVLKEIAELEPRVEDARTRLADIERPLLQGWAAIPALPLGGPTLTREVVEALRDAGNLASIWIETERSLSALERDMQERVRERDDLRFQIAQLKGRLGTMNAESDLDMNEIREKVTSLDTELRHAVDKVIRQAEPVYKHFMSFPRLRDVVLGRAPSSAPAARDS